MTEVSDLQLCKFDPDRVCLRAALIPMRAFPYSINAPSAQGILSRALPLCRSVDPDELALPGCWKFIIGLSRDQVSAMWSIK